MYMCMVYMYKSTVSSVAATRLHSATVGYLRVPIFFFNFIYRFELSLLS